MKMFQVLFFGFSLLFSSQSLAGKAQLLPRILPAQAKKAKEEINKPEVALKMMSRLKTRWSLLKLMQKHISAKDFAEFKKIGDKLKVVYKGPLNLKIVGKNRIKFGSQEKPFTFSHSGKHLKYGKIIFQLDKRKSVFWNYNNIVTKLKSKKTASLLSIFLPMANADSGYADESAGYDILTLLYYMQVHKDGPDVDHVMWDYFVDSEDVQSSANNLHSQGKTISDMRCDTLGMVMEYSDGSRSYITWESQNGQDVGSVSEANGNGMENAVNPDWINQAVLKGGQAFYCSVVQDPDQKRRLLDRFNNSFIQSNPQEVHSSQ